LPPFFNFSFFSHLISPNTTGRQYVTSCCCYYGCSSFFFFKIKICCHKNPQQASSKRKLMRPKTHTHTEKRAGEKATRVHSTQRRSKSLAGEMEGADSDSTVAAGRVTELCRRKAARERGSRQGRL
jgi:hypothetical protein